MKTRQLKKLKFAEMPGDYLGLCQIYLPRPIHDEDAYEAAHTMAKVFAGFEAEMTSDQLDYFEIIFTLMETWEKEHVPAPKMTPLEFLKFTLEQHNFGAADLARILGVSRYLGSMILLGKRAITADHARALGRHFGISAGAFI